MAHHNVIGVLNQTDTTSFREI